MRIWKVVLLLNLALVLGVGWGYLWWGRQVARLQRELIAARTLGVAAEREWTVNGVVRAILPDLDVVVLTHEEIPGLMVPMTMGFRAASPKIYEGVRIGDAVRFTVRGAPPNVKIVAIEKVTLGRVASVRLPVLVVVAFLAVLGGAVPGAASTLYVTNTKSSSLSIIDTNTLEVVGTIPLGAGKPNRVVFHPDGKLAWVVYDKSHDLGVVDAETRKLVRRVKIGGNPYNLAFTPDGRYLYVLDWSSDTSNDEVIMYDLRAEKVDGRVEVSTWPAHGVFSRDGRLFYVSGESAGDVTVIDTAKREIVARIVHGGGDAMGLALRADGRLLYAAAGENKAILKIDTTANKVVGTVPVPGIVHESTLTLDGKFLYVTLRKANKLVVIRTEDDKIVATIPQRAYPDLVTMEPTGRYALVTNRYADAVSVIDLKTHAQIRMIAVGKAPHGMALRPAR